ncbi:hypothetical protein ACTFIY_006895 [Dictyostelium cf. discoideum]
MSDNNNEAQQPVESTNVESQQNVVQSDCPVVNENNDNNNNSNNNNNNNNNDNNNNSSNNENNENNNNNNNCEKSEQEKPKEPVQEEKSKEPCDQEKAKGNEPIEEKETEPATPVELENPVSNDSAVSEKLQEQQQHHEPQKTSNGESNEADANESENKKRSIDEEQAGDIKDGKKRKVETVETADPVQQVEA